MIGRLGHDQRQDLVRGHGRRRLRGSDARTPEPFLGRRIDIASDGPAGREMAEIQSRVTGRTVEDVELPVEAVRVRSHDLALMFEWFDRVGYSADVQPCVVSAPTSAGTRPRRGRGHASSTVGTDSVR